ncbi:MAG TPA: GMP synthase [Flavisolibacter sp.]|jgi:GMP synthase-like glutamine amidotransferase|nr:GMP synthase [Flavisolibacter sp.]
MIRVAILDLNAGHTNQGMRCIRQIVDEWSEFHGIETERDEFDVRQKAEVPGPNYDVYISSGGPGSPLESIGSDWEKAYFGWLQKIEEWNADSRNAAKKHVFFICHSFQLVCRHYAIGNISKRNKVSFGVYPVHVTLEGQMDSAFKGLPDPFYVVDSRSYQVTSPDFEKLNRLGSTILCIEKYRPHLEFEQAVMGIRFNEYMAGTQFHPEADAIGMSMYLQTEEKKKTVIENFSEEKWASMVSHLNDPDKIMWTYAHILPNFLSEAARQFRQSMVA